MRWMVSFQSFFREPLETVYPRIVEPIRIDTKVIDEKALRRVGSTIILYFFTFFLEVLLVEIEVYRTSMQLRPIESMSAVAACVGNIGPGLGAVGPMNNYLDFSAVTKIVLSLLMWAGRLKLFTVFVIFLPRYWKV